MKDMVLNTSKQEVIIDASVIIKWCVPETNQLEAENLKTLHIQEDIRLHIPPITLFEVVNTLIISKKLSLEVINKFLELLMEMDISEEKFDFVDLKNTSQISKSFSLTYYDASYVYLAQKLNTQLITADKKLYEKAKKSGLVKLL